MAGNGEARLEVRLLGRFEVRVDGRLATLPSRPAQSLFAYLIATAGTPHRRERLATMLWPDADEENGRAYLRHALWRIRKALAADPPGDTYIASDDLTVQFDPGSSYRLDVAEFERAADPTDDLAVSVDVYQGELLPGFYDEWAILERERLEALLPQKMQPLLDRLASEARWPEVVDRAERWISLGHAPESAYRALILAHHELGDRSRMAAAYQRCVQALRREVDAEPSDQTRELYERLSRASARSATPVAAAVRAAPAEELVLPERAAPADEEPPFKGLQHFDEADADLFYGREELTTRLVRRLDDASFLAVIGASGSGKSSVLRAGVVPALRRAIGETHAAADAAVRVLTPTSHPLEALAVTLSSGTGRSATDLVRDLERDPRGLRLHLLAAGRPVVLVVDQFEEVFTLCADRSEREVFIDNLLAASLPERDQPARVVLALRADFYAHCAEYPLLREALAGHQEYIGPMGPDDLRRAIEAPAVQRGWTVESGLVEHLVHEVADEPGALPLLSHVLLETWRRREGRALTFRGYSGSGGVRGAIARTAESFFGSADEGERDILRRVFVRLTELGEGTEDTRRRVSLDELTSLGEPGAVADLLRRLADARLVTLGERIAEVSHEALIREWPRLREWLDQDREQIRAQRQLTRAAIEWDRGGRDPDGLYRGVRLQQALAWSTGSPGELTELERTFLDASRESVEREARERQAAAARMRRRAVYLVGALLVLILSIGVAAFFAEQARVNAAATEIEQRRTLLESARAAAENVKSRLDTLRGAIAPEILHRSLSFRAAAITDGLPSRDLGAVLGSIRLVAGPDANLIFMTEYLTDELVAVDEDVAPQENRAGLIARAEVPRRMLAGSAPAGAAVASCAWLPYAQTVPYQPLDGGPPAIAAVHYGPPCRHPYALVLEVTLRRAGEWMGPAVASGDDAYLVDHGGRLLARTRRSADYLRDLSGTELVADALRSTDPFVSEGTDPLGQGSVVAAIAPVGDLGWRVLVVRPVSR